MKNLTKKLGKHAVNAIKHIGKHRTHYVLGLFGSFAIVKMVILFGGLLGVFNYPPTLAALDESICSEVTDITGSRCETLVAIYNATDGDNRTSNEGWGTTGNVCGNWTGILCNGSDIVQLNLNNNHLVGTLPDLSGLVGLENLSLYQNTGLIMDLTTIKDNCNLQRLELGFPYSSLSTQSIVQGDISNLSCMEGLVFVRLSHLSGLFGDISVFAPMSGLDWIELDDADIDGNINAFSHENTPLLRGLFMMNTSVEGDIATFANLQYLTDIRIDQTNVYGDISVFSSDSTPVMNSLTMSVTHVAGDIAVLGALPNIGAIYLNGTHVGGNLSSLSNIPHIGFGIMLQDTNVVGDIAALSGLTQMSMYLILNGSGIYGNLNDISGLTGLNLLRISNSQVVGTLDALLGMTELERVDISDNYLTGDIPVGLPTAISHMGDGVGNINFNLINVEGVTDPDLISFLNMKFGGWRNQRQFLSLRASFSSITSQAGALYDLTLNYFNEGSRIAKAGIFIAPVEGILFSGYTSDSFHLGGIYGVEGDPCYDELLSDTSSGVYYDYMNQTLQDSQSGMTLLELISNVAGMIGQDASINYTGGLHETEGQRMVNFCAFMNEPDLQTCLPLLGRFMGGLDWQFTTMADFSCGTGGNIGYLYTLDNMVAGATGTKEIKFTPTREGDYSINFQIFGLGGIDLSPLDNSTILAMKIANNKVSVSVSGTNMLSGSTLFDGAASTGIVFTTTGDITIYGSGVDRLNTIAFSLNHLTITSSGRNGIIKPPTELATEETGYIAFGEPGVPPETDNEATREIVTTVRAGADVCLTASGGLFALSIYLPTQTSGDTIELYRSIDGYTWHSNTPDTACTVNSNRICNFFTDHMSYFGMINEEFIGAPVTHPSGGPGPALIKDTDKGICAARDCSDSYYDGLCGKCPTTTTGMIHNAADLLISNTGAFNAEVVRIKKVVGSKYSNELIQGYVFAKDAGITSMTDIEKADMKGDLLRRDMAKMIVNFAIRVVNKVPTTGMVCTFTDMQHETSEMQLYAKLACQLGLMGVNTDGTRANQTFNPQETVDRGQFGSILSRLLRGGENNGGAVYYTNHLQALQRFGLMKNISTPENKELRGRVMVMLMRSFLIENK